MTCDEVLIISGGGIQIAGFALALAQSVRTRREQTPEEASLLRWVWAWGKRRSAEAVTWVRVKTEPLLVRLHLMGPRAVAGSASGSLGLRGSLRAYKGTRRPNLPLEDRVAGLEDDVDELRRQQTDDRADLSSEVEAVRTDVEGQQAAKESKRARQLGRELRYQELGVALFIVGVGLSTVGSIA